jgi:molybdopterin molybdotransferase
LAVEYGTGIWNKTPVAVPYEEAIERTLRGVTRLCAERVSIDRAAGRVLAEDIVTREPMPAFAYSAMDGYAARASVFRGDGPWTLPVRGESRAGRPGPPLAPGCASRIFTGAAIPEGANVVILQEDVARMGDSITVRERPHEGQNIRPAGADLARGVTALSAGMRLHPGRLGLLAGLDCAHVLVARRPVMSVISTGDELRPPGVAGAATSIPESNSLVIAAIARRLGAVVRTLPLLADDAERTEQEVRRALRGCDVLVTIGGASVGEHDLVRPAIEAAGVHIDFWGVAIKPGKPIAVGSGAGCRVLCLPGNPASATLTFLLFGVPLLRAMQGEAPVRPRRVPLRVIGSHVRRPGREEFLRARLELHDGELCAVLPASQSSGAVTSFAGADALVVLAAERDRIANGERLPVIQLVDLWYP